MHLLTDVCHKLAWTSTNMHLNMTYKHKPLVARDWYATKRQDRTTWAPSFWASLFCWEIWNKIGLCIVELKCVFKGPNRFNVNIAFVNTYSQRGSISAHPIWHDLRRENHLSLSGTEPLFCHFMWPKWKGHHKMAISTIPTLQGRVQLSSLSQQALTLKFHPLSGICWAGSAQGLTNITFPGSVNMSWNSCIFCTCRRQEKRKPNCFTFTTWEGWFSPALYSTHPKDSLPVEIGPFCLARCVSRVINHFAAAAAATEPPLPKRRFFKRERGRGELVGQTKL